MLPHITNIDELDALEKNCPDFHAAIAAICSRHMVPVPGCELYPSGTSPVFKVGESYVIKFFAPFDLAAFESERQALRFLASASFCSPVPKASGIHDGWGYVLMTRLEGHNLSTLWDSLSPSQQASLCLQTGKLLRTLHSLNTEHFEPAVEWQMFLAGQVKSCAERQRKLGFPEEFVSAIPAFIEETPLPGGKPHVFLHTEIMREHVFVIQNGREQSVSGFIDFEPAMKGPAEYDLVAAGIFLCRGNVCLRKAFYEGYGIVPDSEFCRRMMAYTLLHRYGNLKKYLDFMPHGNSLSDLAGKWWS